jgi:DNA-directed RNA polymerase specialized sigma24 family protein
MPSAGNTGETAGAAAQFTATHWGIVRAAQQTDSEAARASLETLCRRYWYPLYCFLRRSGRSPHDAEDLVQGFIASLLEDDRYKLRQAEEPKGKFRTFLLLTLGNFVKDEARRGRAERRGGGVTHISLDEMAAAEGRYAKEPAASPTPEEEFDRRYACEVIGRALLSLRQHYDTKGKAGIFQALEPFLTEEVPAGFYEQVSPRLNMTAGAVKAELHRFRDRFGALVRRELAQTLEDPRTELRDEIRYVFGVWGRLAAKVL